MNEVNRGANHEEASVVTVENVRYCDTSQLQEVVALSGMGTLFITAELECLFANDILATLLGTQSRLLKNFGWTYFITATELPFIFERVRALLALPEPPIERLFFSVRLDVSPVIATDNSILESLPTDTVVIKYIEAHLRVVRSNTVNGMLIFWHDISEAPLHLYFNDPLTGLLSRACFTETLKKNLEQVSPYDPLAIFYIDLAHFKRMNEAYGYELGDDILREVALRLKTVSEESFPIIRMSGDEFLLIHPTIRDYFGATEFAEKLLAALLQPVDLSPDLKVQLSVSIGILLVFNKLFSVDFLMKQVELALLKAKSAGKNTYAFYSSEFQETHDHRYSLIQKLHFAIENEEIQVFYQPQKSISDDQIIGYEALIRWNHAENGMIKPDFFVPLLEENDLIEHYGFWVLKTACMQYHQWLRKGYVSEETHLAVNLSPYQLRKPNFVAMLDHLLKTLDFPPERLSIELTESTLLDNNARTLITLRSIKDMGVRLALDDFGAGYASLSYLKKIPLDIIKIDRQFITHLATNQVDRAITESVIGLAKALGIYVIAEGVDSYESLSVLKSLGCDGYQGYFISEPQPANRIYMSDEAAE